MSTIERDLPWIPTAPCSRSCRRKLSRMGSPEDTKLLLAPATVSLGGASQSAVAGRSKVLQLEIASEDIAPISHGRAVEARGSLS